MFDFIRKPFLWDAWDRKLQAEFGDTQQFHLKSIQDLAVFVHLREMEGRKIAEIGGGASRVLRAIAARNVCVNVEKFEGADGGPAREIVIPGVANVLAYLGEGSPLLESGSFDAVFSVSVVEHVPNDRLAAFLDDGLRILKPGGLWLHAIDLYVEDAPSPGVEQRFGAYLDWIRDPRLVPVGPVFEGPACFSCDMASNPDNAMYAWGAIAPTLIPLRKRAQSVSLIMAATKR